MKTTFIKGVTISHVWNDLSATDFDIECYYNDKIDEPVVDVESYGNKIRFMKDSWPEIRNRIDLMFKQNHSNDKKPDHLDTLIIKRLIQSTTKLADSTSEIQKILTKELESRNKPYEEV